jgi:predicted nucleic acid-binding protein
LTDLHYIDTSFLAPYYLPEASSEAVESALRNLPPGSLLISPLVRTELASLLARKCGGKEMAPSDARRAMQALDAHVGNGVLRVAALGARHFERATEWIMAMKHPLRAPDAVHLAVAAGQDAVFWTLDKALARAAKWVGLTTRSIKTPSPK